MGASSFNEMELDAIGEIMNISLGASATAVSTMLGTKVNITTPVVLVQSREEFEFKRLEPAIGVVIDYVEGLDGKNIMMFRKEDIRIIVGTMMGEDPPADAFEMMDELYISAICEVMNQMMGSSATALSEFLGTIVNISTPKSFEVGEPEEFKDTYFTEESGMVIVRFRLEIENKLNSEFMNLMPIKLAKRLLEPFADSLGDAGAEEVPAPAAPAPEPAPQPMPAAPAAPAPQPAPAAPQPMPAAPAAPTPAASAPTPAAQPAPMPQPMPQMDPTAMQAMPQQPYYAYPPAGADPMMLQLLNQMQQTQMQMMEMMKNVKTPDHSSSSGGGSSIIRPLASPQMQDQDGTGEEDKTNQEMLMKVPLEISVEIGRTKRLVKDILEFTQGTLVVLDKMAGEQVDLFVNGQCIARGDIVVVEDNFGIRVTEIVSRELHPESL
ncbi:flagellar motor switch phosphatase FliY [bacterium D16-54]|mgnify:FL=1|nr:flagellar motor switch phosphatase FliY [bacterium D16-54]RKJ13063.1 flagellar motor switch phosphatase FliY [bacterium D16-56]